LGGERQPVKILFEGDGKAFEFHKVQLQGAAVVVILLEDLGF